MNLTAKSAKDAKITATMLCALCVLCGVIFDSTNRGLTLINADGVKWNTDCAEYTSTYASALAYVCTQSTGVTVDTDARGSVNIRPIRVLFHR